MTNIEDDQTNFQAHANWYSGAAPADQVGKKRRTFGQRGGWLLLMFIAVIASLVFAYKAASADVLTCPTDVGLQAAFSACPAPTMLPNPAGNPIGSGGGGTDVLSCFSSVTQASPQSACAQPGWYPWGGFQPYSTILTHAGWYRADKLSTVPPPVVTPPPPPVEPSPPSNPVFTGQSLLSWVPPITNSDGSTLTNLAGFRIYFGQSISTLNQTIEAPGAATTSYTVTGLSDGTWYFSLTAYAATGSESDRTAAVSKVINGSTSVCPTAPAAETRPGTCPSGTQGAWTQSRPYVAIAYPTCWVTGTTWVPANAPTGACTAIPPPPATWVVQSIAAGTRPAYELVRNQADTAWAQGYKLGDIPVGKQCDAAIATGSYHKVAESDTVLLSPTYRGRTLIAVCVKQ